MRFGDDDVQRFAAWSRDRNPLHVDADAARRSFFGQPVVHGVLSVLHALTTPDRQPVPPARLDVEFRGAVFTDTPYTVETDPAGATVAVRAGDTALLTAVLGAGPASAPDLGWSHAACARRDDLHRARLQPASLDAGDLRKGVEVVGLYETGDVPADYTGGGRLLPVQARVLGLCSYIIGMELPGLRSLFTRLSLNFGETAVDSPALVYRARVTRFDPQFRILDVEIEVVTPGGLFIAAGDLRAYVRFSPVVTEPATLASHLSDEAPQLAGQVVLVCGGGRGLGAELTAALAVSGAHIYASYRRDGAAARELTAAIEAAGSTVSFLEGDAGDQAWCDAALESIVSRHGRLDAVVLNACAPPSVLRLGPRSSAAYRDYISANLPLAQVPLATCLPALSASGGTVVCISSSFVDEQPAGFGHYVALKEAVEATVRAAVRETPGIRAVIARPPRLQTTWNDTPTGVLGTIPASDAALHIVKRMAAREGAGAIDVMTAFPLLERAPRQREPQGPPEFYLGLSASFTLEPILDGLEFWFRELGVRGEIETAPYGQILQTLLSPNGGLTGRPGMHVVLLRLRDWLRELAPEDAASDTFVRSYLEATAHDLERALRTHRAQASAETVLVLCPSAAERPDMAEPLLEEAESNLLAKLAGLPGLTSIRAHDFHAAYGVSDDIIADHFREHLAHIPYQRAYFHTLATIVMRHVHRKLTPARKVVVVDCDNTLWRGVVGEAGAEGLLFDDGHAALHETLVRLAGAGVLIALCSKNEEPDVWRVFETRHDLALRREHLVTAMINWQPKSANLRAMAERLNLGLDSFVFIDDNPVECAEVRAACPEVLTIEWPQEPERAIQLLRHTWELDPRGGTAEDERRTALYKEEFRRQELQAQTLTFRDFIASLDLVVDISPLAPDDLKRASQLTLRTNQFNFTTRRRDEGALQGLAAAGAHEIRTVRVRDRFGDYGLVGLLIAELTGGEVFADTFLLSCRVLGRGVEHQMVAELGRIAAAAGAATVRMRVEPTKRNTPARGFLETVVPDANRQTTDGVIEARMPAAVVAAITFEPPDQAGPAIAEDGGTPSAPADATRLRSRESQIARAAFDLATPAGLAGAIDGTPSRSAAPAASSTAADSAFVVDAFAAALKMPADRVRELDTLEALGCDSFKIVEITVALLERFPRLPATLLFEHKAVSDIARQIAALSTAGEPGAAPAIAAAPARDHQARQSNDIAVVGMHVRTAGAQSTSELWDLLSAGGIAVAPVPADRRYFFGRLDDTRPHFAGLVEDVDRFDTELFGITPREAEVMDPQLRLFLEVAFGALEDAGCLGDDMDPDTGVFAGVMYADYATRANPAAKAAGNPFKCWEGFSLANRLSQVFGFSGPSLAIDTACSSSGTAVHMACRALLAGDCRVAVAGGVNLILDPDRFVQLGRLGILSESGRCLAFGDEADGTVLGEGAGVVVLRPLADAIARGDRIYGVIKGTGVSTGSGTVGFTAPNPVAQAEAIRRSVRAAGIDPRTIGYVETHGTGTSLGDPIEVRGLTLAYTDPQAWDGALQGVQSCTIGSIKPNIGHLEAGAGVLGLIKLLLQLHRRTLLPSVTSAQPNPHIPFAQTPFEIQRTLAPWERPRLDVDGRAAVIPRRGALNSFGVGGANAHLIVEEAPEASDPPAVDAMPTHHLLAVSARTADALERRLGELAQALEGDPDLAVADLCHSIVTGRRALGRRAAIVARTRADMASSLRALAAGDEPAGTMRGVLSRAGVAPKIAFLFTGQGSQHAGMGRELYETQPVFRRALDRCFELFAPVLDADLRAAVFADAGTPEAARLNQTGTTQPALFSLGYALAELWRAWGIEPDVVMGHSIGELTAMCVAGGLTLEDAVRMVAARGRLMQALPEGGSMASVMAPESRLLPALAEYAGVVSIAALNGPEQTVISGRADAVAALASRFAADGIKSKALVVSHAFHSPLMNPMLADYEAVLRGVRFATPATTFVSCVLGRVADAELLTGEYWLRNVIDPVRFTDGIRVVDGLGVSACIEMGPQPVLLGMGRQCLAHDDEDDQGATLWLPSIRKDAPAWPVLLDSLGQLYVSGARIDWRGFGASRHAARVALPPYPFGGKRHWLDASAIPVAAASPRASRAAAYEITWRPAATARTANAAGLWLVCAGGGAAGEAVARDLESRGAQCRVVDDAAAIELLKAGGIAGLVHISATGAGHSSVAGKAVAQVERTTSIMRAVAAAPADSTPRLWIVTRLAVAAGGDRTLPVDAAQSAVWGAGRTFSLEHPERWGGLIDIAAGGSTEVDARAIVDALLVEDDEDQVAIRSGGRLVPRLARTDVPQSAPVVFDSGTWLVTGGLGALGLHTARWLASRGVRHLVLASRTGLQAPGADDAVRSLTALGVTVGVVAADVAEPSGITAIFDAVAGGPPLAGIVHAAGVDDTRPVADLAPGDIARVMAAKATGAWLLHERSRDLPLQAFVCFSSIASVLGSAGRAGYGAANAFLDGLVHERRRLGLPGTAINWGPWAGGGMATTDALEQYRRVGNHAVAPADGLRLMEAIVGGGLPQATVADIDWAAFRPAYEARRPRPMIASLDETAAPAPAEDAVEARAPWVARLASLPDDARLDDMTTLLRGEIAQTLGFDGAADVDVEQPFRDMGMDSLMSADFAQRLQKRLGIRATALVFQFPSVSLLAPNLLGKLELTAAPAGEPAIAAAIAEPRSTPAEPRSPIPALVVVGVSSAESVATHFPVSEAAPATAARRQRAPVALDGGRTEGYRPGVEAEVAAFQTQAWPARRPDLIEPRWRWMFVDSARRLNVAPRVWLHRQDGVIVGHNGAIPVRLKIGDDERPTAWLVDTMVLEAYRSQAVGVRLMEEAHDDLPFALSLGQTEQMRAIQLRLGWHQVAPLETAQLLLRPERVLKGKLPGPAALAAGLALRASGAMRDALRQRSTGRVRAIAGFDASHDRIWAAMAREVTCAVRRDASYLNWKYVAQPGQEFVRLEVGAQDGARGLVVLMFREPDEAYAYRRAFIVDVVAPLSNARLMTDLLVAAATAAMERGADALLCLHVGQPLTAALQQAGYRMRQPSRYLLVRPGPDGGELAERLLSPAGWFVTHGDSDIDRP